MAVGKLADLKGLGLRELAEALDMPYRTVQNYLTGNVKIPSTFISRACRLFAVEADYLIWWGVDLDKQALREAVRVALGDVLGAIDFQDGRVVVRSDGEKSFTEPAAQASHQQSILLQIASNIRDEYTFQRLLALRQTGRPGVSPSDAASDFRLRAGSVEDIV